MLCSLVEAMNDLIFGRRFPWESQKLSKIFAQSFCYENSKFPENLINHSSFSWQLKNWCELVSLNLSPSLSSFSFCSSKEATFNRRQLKPVPWEFKDAHREIALSNETPALTKRRNMGIWVFGTSNQLFIRGS